MSTIIQVKDLNLWYGAHHALHGVNIDIPEHEITALIGPSGCGKSTFLKTLNRMNDLVPGIRIEGELVNLISAVISRISIAGEIGNSRHHHNRVSSFIPSHNQIADFCFTPVDKTIIESLDVLSIAHDQAVLLAVLHCLIKQCTYLFCVGCALFHIRLRSLKQFAE